MLAECILNVILITGGFGGGPGQLPHLAPTYAAVNALSLIETKDAHRAIDL